MNRKVLYIYLSVCTTILILLMMLYLPGGSDIYIFSMGGKMLLSGLTPYKDFIDSKPPGIFVLYASIHSLFGGSILSVRVFDLLYHIVTLIIFYHLVKKYSGNSHMALLIPPIYALWYISMGIWDTAQSESFALLPTLLIVSIVQRTFSSNKPLIYALLYGCIAGVITIGIMSLKFTLLYVLICAIFILFWKHPSKLFASVFSIASLLCIVIGAFLFYHWLHASGAESNFSLMMEWLQRYSDNHPFSDYRTYSNVYLLRFPQTLLSVFSPINITLCVIGIAITFRSNNEQQQSLRLERVFVLQLLTQLAIGLITIMLERKNIRYHFSRSFWAMTPFICIGLAFCAEQVNRAIRTKTNFLRKSVYSVLLVSSCLIAIALSPILKVLSESGSYVLHSTVGYKTSAYEGYANIGQEEQLDIVEQYLRTKLQSNETFFFWGTIIRPYTHLEMFPPTIMMMNLQVSAPWSPPELRKQVLDQLERTKPRYFIVQSGDFMPDLSQTIYDSFGLLIMWEDLFNFWSMNYQECLVLDNFVIYEYSPPQSS